MLRPIKHRYRALVYLSAIRLLRTSNASPICLKAQRYPAIHPEVVAPTEIAIPDEPVILSFSELVSPILEQMVSNKREDNTLAQTRDMLLPRLMDGEIHLRDAERDVEAVA